MPRNGVVTVTKKQRDYLTSLTKKDRLGNIHAMWVDTDESTTVEANAEMMEQQRFAMAVRAETQAVADEEVVEVEAPAPKRRAKKATGTRGTRNASKVVA